ncbi:MAG: riboflavin kinase [Patescibacteria group bacterium]
MKLTGKILHGAGRGRGLGFPTLNIEGEFLDLEQGVYAVWASVGEGRYEGAMNYGPQPTFGVADVRVEVFLLNFEGEVHGEQATVTVVKKIRDTRKFDSAEELKVQIAQDVEDVKEVLYNDRT